MNNFWGIFSTFLWRTVEVTRKADKQRISLTNNNESDGNHPNAVECLRLKNSLVEILEELKLRRVSAYLQKCIIPNEELCHELWLC